MVYYSTTYINSMDDTRLTYNLQFFGYITQNLININSVFNITYIISVKY
jgi:hypothetical protein